MKFRFSVLIHFLKYANDDLKIIRSRGSGLEDSFKHWKETYIKDLWEEFGEVPMNPETEEIEQSWRHFLPGISFLLFYQMKFRFSVLIHFLKYANRN